MRLFLVLIACCVISASASAAPSAAQLAKDRVAAAEKTYGLVAARLKAGQTTVETVYQWSVRWLDSAIAADARKAKAALADHVARMKDLETEAMKARDVGTASAADAEAATYFRIEAEHWQARGKR